MTSIRLVLLRNAMTKPATNNLHDQSTLNKREWSLERGRRKWGRTRWGKEIECTKREKRACRWDGQWRNKHNNCTLSPTPDSPSNLLFLFFYSLIHFEYDLIFRQFRIALLFFLFREVTFMQLHNANLNLAVGCSMQYRSDVDKQKDANDEKLIIDPYMYRRWSITTSNIERCTRIDTHVLFINP